MRYGMNLLVWTDTLADSAIPLLDELKAIGYDVVELPCYDLDNLENYAAWGKRLDALGLARTGARSEARTTTRSAPTRRSAAKGSRRTSGTLDCCQRGRLLGDGRSVSFGVGRVSAARDRPPTNGDWAADSMREVAEHAATAA